MLLLFYSVVFYAWVSIHSFPYTICGVFSWETIFGFPALAAPNCYDRLCVAFALKFLGNVQCFKTRTYIAFFSPMWFAILLKWVLLSGRAVKCVFFRGGRWGQVGLPQTHGMSDLYLASKLKTFGRRLQGPSVKSPALRSIHSSPNKQWQCVCLFFCLVLNPEP